MFQLLRNMKIKKKLILGTISIITFSFLIVIGVVSYTISSRSDKYTKKFRDKQVEKYKVDLKNYVEIAYKTMEANYKNSTNHQYLEKRYGHRLSSIIDLASSVIQSKITLVKNGKMSLQAAKLQAMEEIRNMRYDKGSGYIWINSTEKPYPRMLMHPTVRATEGNIMNDPKYNTAMGKKQNLFQAFLEVCNKNGEGFVDYEWPKPTKDGLTKYQPKLSYVRLFNEWGWIVGTGIYIDDAVKDAKKNSLEIIRTMRYGKTKKDYFWVNDSTEPNPIMLMHPVATQLENKILEGKPFHTALGTYITDKGINPGDDFVAVFVKWANKDGEAYVDYTWPKPTGDGVTKKNEPKMSYVKKFKEWDWIIGTGVYIDEIKREVTIYKNEIKAQIAEIVIILLIVTIIVNFLAVFIVYLFANSISRPINKLVQAFKKMASGDLTQKLDYQSKDEIGILASDFNDLIDVWNRMIQQIKQVMERTQDLSENLSASAEESAASLEEMTAYVIEMKDKTRELNIEVGKSRKSAEDVKKFVLEVADLIASQAKAITNSTDFIGVTSMLVQGLAKSSEGKLEVAHELEKTAGNGGVEMKKTLGLIKKVADSAHVIMDMITVINGIAEQTNLLAMNAAIEAAHAGDAGRGFAVVADEIRKLAESTAKNSNEISRSLKEVLDFIKLSEESTTKTGESFVNIVSSTETVTGSISEMTEVLSELVTSNDELIGGLDNLLKVTEEVKTSSSMMKDKGEEVTHFMSNLNLISSETFRGMEEVSKSIEELNKVAEIISDAGIQNADNVSELEELISQFKIDAGQASLELQIRKD